MTSHHWKLKLFERILMLTMTKKHLITLSGGSELTQKSLILDMQLQFISPKVRSGTTFYSGTTTSSIGEQRTDQTDVVGSIQELREQWKALQLRADEEL